MTAAADINKFVRALKKAVNATQDRTTLTAIAKAAVDKIVERTRRGFGVKTVGGNRTPLKPLADSTIQNRRRSNLSPFTSATKSNLTFTGQLLNSLSFRFVRDGKIVVVAKGNRSDGQTNKKVATFVSIDRPFLALSRVELRELTDTFGEALDANLKKQLRGL
jgi:hypothetical protein